MQRYRLLEPPGFSHGEVQGFRVVSVFALEQTEGEPFIPPTPQLLTGQDYVEPLARVLAHCPVPVTLVDPAVLHGANGDYHPDTQAIRVRNDVEAAQQLKTLLHELAHYFGRSGPTKGASLSRSWEECAAESTAYLACGLIGLDSIAYSAAYVGRWADGDVEQVSQLVATIGHRLAVLRDLLHAASLLTAEPRSTETPAASMV